MNMNREQCIGMNKNKHKMDNMNTKKEEWYINDKNGGKHVYYIWGERGGGGEYN